jgi:hypothetical protein
MINNLQSSLTSRQEVGSELGIEYAGHLSREDNPSQRELEHSLDDEHLLKIREENNPTIRRSNFRYIEKRYDKKQGFTRYILANG